MLCGTLPAIGGVRPSRHYTMALEDDRGAKITLSYGTTPLNIVR
jgi:hypothetical protein